MRLDLDAIRRDFPLPAVAAKLVPLRAVGSEWVACCPFHRERSPSFTIFDGGRRFHCFGCGATGDVLDFVQRAYAVRLPEAARMLGAGAVPIAAAPKPEHSLTGARSDTRPAALRIWNRGTGVAGTPAEAYLRFRGISGPFPSALRFLSLPCGEFGPLPCLICAVRDIAGEITGIQRIWLANDGRGKADVAKPKRSLGQVKGGAIRLGDPETGNVIAVCEGPEDGLSLAAMLGGPVWAAGGADFLPAMQFPPVVRSIVIGADNDAAGEAKAMEAARAFARRGLTVRIIRPAEGFKDFNDELRGARDGC